MKWKDYSKELRKLQTELCHLQEFCKKIAPQSPKNLQIRILQNSPSARSFKGLAVLHGRLRKEGLRVIIVFEGRDAAGKGGTIKAITERVSPRVFRAVALPAPSDREKTQLYMQRSSSISPPQARS